MEIRTEPASRFGWQGETLHYVVKAEGATEISAPHECPDGMKARVTSVRQVGGGVEADVEVQLIDPSFY